MKISFVSTVFNEEDSIEVFLKSLLSQTQQSDEIIIVDAFSKDKTFELLQQFIPKFKNKKVKFEILKKRGNRSVGRNFGIKKASGEIIVMSDAGCILDKNWVKNISKPLLEKEIDVVAGYYYPKTNGEFEKSLASYTCVMPDKINPEQFLPSSRSVAFRKEAWKKVKGYPEDLDTCEDLVFARNLKKAGLKFRFEKKAFVLWPQRKNIIEAFRQFFSYAMGDGKALYIRPKTPYLFLRYFFGLALLIFIYYSKLTFLLYLAIFCIAVYLTWAIFKNYKYVKSPLAFLYLPLLQITADIAVISGFSIGFISRKG